MMFESRHESEIASRTSKMARVNGIQMMPRQELSLSIMGHTIGFSLHKLTSPPHLGRLSCLLFWLFSHERNSRALERKCNKTRSQIDRSRKREKPRKGRAGRPVTKYSNIKTYSNINSPRDCRKCALFFHLYFFFINNIFERGFRRFRFSTPPPRRIMYEYVMKKRAKALKGVF